MTWVPTAALLGFSGVAALWSAMARHRIPLAVLMAAAAIAILVLILQSPTQWASATAAIAGGASMLALTLAMLRPARDDTVACSVAIVLVSAGLVFCANDVLTHLDLLGLGPMPAPAWLAALLAAGMALAAAAAFSEGEPLAPAAVVGLGMGLALNGLLAPGWIVMGLGALAGARGDYWIVAAVAMGAGPALVGLI